ncbi:MAG TPA: hypothetical protein DIT65_00185, partial [Cryomorphaceae bacterium]|nr:hypothetical protein [Cryomorphaceae bacterium]
MILDDGIFKLRYLVEPNQPFLKNLSGKYFKQLTEHLICRFVTVIWFLIPVVSFAQPQILQGITDVTDSTITSCGSSGITLTNNSTATTLTWSTQKLSSSPGAGSLSPTTGTGFTQTFTPTISGVDAYTITLSDGTDSSTVILVFGPTPDIAALNIPSSLCENGGFQTVTTTIDSTQSLSFSAGLKGTSGSTVTLNPQGIADGTSITIKLTETYDIPGTTNKTFQCTNTDSLTIYQALTPSLTLSTSTFQKCDPKYALPSGGTYSITGYPNAIVSGDSLDPAALPVGVHNLLYTVVDTNGCSNSTTVPITITGFVFSGSGLNLFVREVTATGSTPIFPGIYNGVTTFSICGSTISTFEVDPLSGLSNFTNYTITWGDGSPAESDSTSNTIAHQYNNAGLHQISLSLIDSNGCQLDTVFNVFFGSTQSIQLSNIPNYGYQKCLSNDSVAVDFLLDNWQNDPDSVTYKFITNDGSDTVIALSPLVKNGVSRYPFLIFNSDSTIYYRTYYKQSSCGATHPSYGSNQFFVNAFKIGPCPGSQAPAVAGPAVISVPPDAIIEAPLTICIDDTALIEDVSISGQLVKASGQNYNCDTTTDGYWEIFNATWTLINPPGSGIQSLSGTLGSSNGVPSIPAFWTAGSKNISLSFNAPGTYHIVKHIGVSSSNGPLCSMDSDTLTICIDSIPIVQPAVAIVDTICLGEDIDFTFVPDSVNCDSLNTYAFYVIDLDSSNIVYQDSSQTNLSHSYTPTSTGPYQTIARVSNHCGTSTLVDTIYVFDSPDITLDSIAVCGDSVIISFGVSPYVVTWTDSFAAPDSVYYWITPASTNSWTLLGTNQYGQDSIIVWDAKNYTIYATAYNICGQVNLSSNFRLDSIPNPNFVLQDTSGCDSLQPVVSNVYNAPGYTHVWNVYSDSLLNTYTSATPIFTTYYNSSGTVFTIQHIVISDQGCSDTAESTFFVNPTPLAAFNIDSAACAPWTP